MVRENVNFYFCFVKKLGWAGLGTGRTGGPGAAKNKKVKDADWLRCAVYGVMQQRDMNVLR